MPGEKRKPGKPFAVVLPAQAVHAAAQGDITNVRRMMDDGTVTHVDMYDAKVYSCSLETN